MFTPETSVGLEDMLTTVSWSTGVSRSATVNGIGAVAVSSWVTWSGMSDTVGAALIVTVSVPVARLFVAWPSLTVTVMLAVPLVLGTGRKVSEPVLEGLL